MHMYMPRAGEKERREGGKGEEERKGRKRKEGESKLTWKGAVSAKALGQNPGHTLAARYQQTKMRRRASLAVQGLRIQAAVSIVKTPMTYTSKVLDTKSLNSVVIMTAVSTYLEISIR